MRINDAICFTKNACIPDYDNPCPEGKVAGIIISVEKRIYRVLVRYPDNRYPWLPYRTCLISVWKKQANSCSNLEYVVLTGRDYYMDKETARKEFNWIYL